MGQLWSFVALHNKKLIEYHKSEKISFIVIANNVFG